MWRWGNESASCKVPCETTARWSCRRVIHLATLSSAATARFWRPLRSPSLYILDSASLVTSNSCMRTKCSSPQSRWNATLAVEAVCRCALYDILNESLAVAVIADREKPNVAVFGWKADLNLKLLIRNSSINFWVKHPPLGRCAFNMGGSGLPSNTK